MRLMRSMWRMVVLLELLLHASAQLVWRRPTSWEERARWLHELCRRAIRRFGVTVRSRAGFRSVGL